MDAFNALEFDVILNELSRKAVSDTVKRRCLSLSPYMETGEIGRRLDETSQARQIMALGGEPPLSAMTELNKIMTLLSVESMLVPEQLEFVSSFIATCRRMAYYLKRSETEGNDVSYYGGAFIDLSAEEDEIERCVRGGQVNDRASQRLFDLRRSIDNKKEQIRNKLDQILRQNKEYFSDGFLSMRGG